MREGSAGYQIWTMSSLLRSTLSTASSCLLRSTIKIILCHELDGEGENAGPNLGKRGTLAWVEAVISDAGQGRLFGEKNKMPKFSGKLTPAEIEDMARFVIAQKIGH